MKILWLTNPQKNLLKYFSGNELKWKKDFPNKNFEIFEKILKIDTENYLKLEISEIEILEDKRLKLKQPLDSEWQEVKLKKEELEQYATAQGDDLVLDDESGKPLFFTTRYISDNIKLIITENDYYQDAQKKYIDATLKSRGFKRVYVQCGGWECRHYDKFPDTYMNFFEVWKK